MCVIIYKPKNTDIKKNTLKKAWQYNSDGAGISFQTNNKIQVMKGIMLFDEFLKIYNDLKHLELVIHFRFATHGAVIPEFTHPFKVQKTHCTKTVFEADEILHHNGVISGFGNKNLSDTVDFITKILSGANTIEAKKYILQKTPSLYALHVPDSIHLIGNFEKHKGCLYSNLNFLNTWVFYPKKSFTDNNLLNLAETHIDEYFTNNNWLDFPDFSDFISIYEGVEFTKKQKDYLNKYVEDTKYLEAEITDDYNYNWNN